MRTGILITAALAVALSGDLVGQGRDRLVGTWRLASASAWTADGNTDKPPFGSSPTGILMYTAEGRMAALISYGGRKPLSGADRIAAPAEERAEAFATFFAYSGRYSLTGDKVVHHVEIASVENWVNTDLVRLIKLEGDRITLRTPPLSVGGTIITSELVWERVK